MNPRRKEKFNSDQFQFYKLFKKIDIYAVKPKLLTGFVGHTEYLKKITPVPQFYSNSTI
jgi:hypothetical protein